MKVVLFCGGLGMRIRESGDNTPKPMVNIGYRPILWHVMKYYAHHGHKDFVLCLGYRADYIKNYFLNYNECLSNDFTLSQGGKSVQLFNNDTEDWKITFVDTGLHSNIGQRLKAVEEYVGDEEMFLANYSDGLTDLPLPEQIAQFQKHDKIGSFLCVKPNLSYHLVTMENGGLVSSLCDISRSALRINGGYFIFKKDIFRYIEEGEELVHEPFQRLIQDQQLTAYPYDGFWVCMDTFKDRQKLEELYSSGEAPWEIWRTSSRNHRSNITSPANPSASLASR